MEKVDVVVIGGGAAGFFAAISCRTHHPKSKVVILERSERFLAKVSISGGGRCNVTHNEKSVAKLCRQYPRGEKFLKPVFDQFGVKETIEWFESNGVELKVEDDGRMFPTTDKSETIVNALLKAAKKLKIDTRMAARVDRIQKKEGAWLVDVIAPKDPDSGYTIQCNSVVVATGGAPKVHGLAWLEKIGCPIIPPVPSIFSFNMPNEEILRLQGVVASDVSIRVQGIDHEAEGPLLITHWGMSGPAVLRLSAFAARELSSKEYKFTVRVRWISDLSEDKAHETLHKLVSSNPKKQIGNESPFELPASLWKFLLQKAGLDATKPIGELGKKGINKITEVLLNDKYEADGRTAFKEEFVTAGGVANASIDPKTMESKKRAGLFLAGEVVNIDGVTGGFNFQAAWSTGFVAGKNAGNPT
jgi:predicted Rossmann fold flavoprotein